MNIETSRWNKRMLLVFAALSTVLILLITGLLVKTNVEAIALKESVDGFYSNNDKIIEVKNETRTTVYDDENKITSFAVNGDFLLTWSETKQLILTNLTTEESKVVPFNCEVGDVTSLQSVAGGLFTYIESCEDVTEERSQYLTSLNVAADITAVYPVDSIGSLIVDYETGEAAFQDGITNIVSLQTVDTETGQWNDTAPQAGEFGFIGGFYLQPVGGLVLWGTDVYVSDYVGYNYDEKALVPLSLPEMDGFTTEVAFQSVLLSSESLLWLVTVMEDATQEYSQLLVQDSATSSVYFNITELDLSVNGQMSVNSDRTLLSIPVKTETGVTSNLILDVQTKEVITTVDNSNVFVFRNS